MQWGNAIDIEVAESVTLGQRRGEMDEHLALAGEEALCVSEGVRGYNEEAPHYGAGMAVKRFESTLFMFRWGR